MRKAIAAAVGLLAALPVVASDKIRIEIVESTSIIQMLPATIPGRPERISTDCAVSTAGNTAKGDCNTTITPATGPRAGVRPAFLFSAKAILPDGTHVDLDCIAGIDKDCAAIAPMAVATSTSSCSTAGNVTTCTARGLGLYSAKRNKDSLLIYSPKGKLRYRIIGTW